MGFIALLGPYMIKARFFVLIRDKSSIFSSIFLIIMEINAKL